jgi:hypothetical protein
LTSKIINMADKLKDAEDRFLESVFTADVIADDGFSDRVLRTIRRRIWVQRLALPIAVLLGGTISIKPLSQLLLAASKLLTVMPQELFIIPDGWMPQLQTVFIGAMLLAAGMLGIRSIE